MAKKKVTSKKGRKKGKKKNKGPTTANGFPLDLFKRRYKKMQQIARASGVE